MGLFLLGFAGVWYTRRCVENYYCHVPLIWGVGLYGITIILIIMSTTAFMYYVVHDVDSRKVELPSYEMKMPKAKIVKKVEASSLETYGPPCPWSPVPREILGRIP